MSKRKSYGRNEEMTTASIYISKDLLKKIDEAAEADERSRNWFILKALQEQVSNYEQKVAEPPTTYPAESSTYNAKPDEDQRDDPPSQPYSYPKLSKTKKPDKAE